MINEILEMGRMVNVDSFKTDFDSSIIRMLPTKKNLNVCLVFSEGDNGVNVSAVSPEADEGIDWKNTRYFYKDPHNQFPLFNINCKKIDDAALPYDMSLDFINSFIENQSSFKNRFAQVLKFSNEIAQRINEHCSEDFPEVNEKIGKLVKLMSEVSIEAVLSEFCKWLSVNASPKDFKKLQVHMMVDNLDLSDKLSLVNGDVMKAISLYHYKMSESVMEPELGNFSKIQPNKSVCIQPYSRNVDIDLLNRYGLSGVDAISYISVNQKRDVYKTLSWLAHPSRENKTWKNLSVGKNANVVFLFAADHVINSEHVVDCENESLDVEETVSTSLIENRDSVKTDTDDYTIVLDETDVANQAKSVADATILPQGKASATEKDIPRFSLKYKVDAIKSIVKPNVPVMILAILVPKNGANSIAYANTFTTKEILDSCSDWIDSCQKVGSAGGFDVMNIANVLNKRWTRNSIGSSVGEVINGFEFFSIVDVFDWMYRSTDFMTSKIVSVLSANHANLIIDVTSFGRASIFAKTEKKSKGDHAIYDTKKIKALIAHVSKRVVSPINQWDGYKLGAIIKNFESIQIAYHKNVQEKRGTKTGFVPSGKELCHLAVESPWRCLKHILARSPVYVDWIIKQDNQELHNLVKYFRYSVENLKDLDFSNGDLKLGVAVGYSNIPVK